MAHSDPTRIRVPRRPPRSWQREVLDALDDGFRRLVVVAHRRSGKSVLGLSMLLLGMLDRVGLYLHVFPFFNQGRKVIWDGIDHQGEPFRAHFPAPYVRSVNETEMQVELVNGSIYQIVGTDAPDRLRGINPRGVVFDEYAFADSNQSYEILRPVLLENGGWAAFLSTPNGRNHFYELFQQAQERPDWFSTLKGAADTRRDGEGEDHRPIVTAADVAEEILAGTPEAHARQEYECSFLAAVVGAYYTQELERIERDGRIRPLPWSPALEVVTAWDLGIADQTAIIFAQVHGPEVRIIDFYQHRGESLAHYAKVLSEKPYRYRDHFLPHDVENRLDDFGSGTTRREILLSLGVRPCRTVPRRPLEDAIPAVKHFFARCYFDRDKCRPLLKALAHYHADWKAERQVHGLRPVHTTARCARNCRSRASPHARNSTPWPSPRRDPGIPTAIPTLPYPQQGREELRRCSHR